MIKPHKSISVFLRDAALSAKLAAMLTVVGILSFVGIMLMLSAIITPSFDRLESEAVAGHVDRTNAALKEYASKVEIAVKDYGVWDDSYKYMNSGGAEFVKNVFSILAFTNLDINGMAYVRNDGSIQYSRYVDIQKQADNAALKSGFDALITSDKVLRLAKSGESANFYARLGNHIVAIAVAKVFRSDGSGTTPGFVVMARQISSEQLSHLIQLDARFGFKDPHRPTTIVEYSENLEVIVDIDGLSGSHIANAHFTIPRDFALLGTRMLKFAVLGTAALLVLVLLVLRRQVSLLVINPLSRVEQHMQGVSASGHLRTLAEPERGDEIGSLIRTLNIMLVQLKELREQVEMQSFKLGQSESAIGVMHNVRNGLNPVNVIVSQMMNIQPAVRPEDAARALGELAREDVAPVRRQKLAAFLTAAIDVSNEQANRYRHDVESARNCLNSVLEMIGQQQTVAHDHIETETCDIIAALEQNAAMARYAARGPIEFECPAGSVAVRANRILLTQVLGNVIANAVEAIAATDRNPGRISVKIRNIPADAGNSVEVQIEDDGEGFDPSLKDQLFQRGFSTRAQRSGGLGLHWCANTIKAMQGSLTLSSPGAGRGATAILTLRAEQEKVVGPLLAA